MFGRKGQGALEYLLILAAVLIVAVVAILVMNHVQSKAGVKEVAEDKYQCSLAGIKLLDYDKPYDGTFETAPGRIIPCGNCAPINKEDYATASDISQSEYAGVLNTSNAFASCKIRGYTLYVYLYGDKAFAVLKGLDVS